jgi:hypothetical protein
VCTRKTPDDGQRNCSKHVEFHSKKKFEKLMHLVDFIIRKEGNNVATRNASDWQHQPTIRIKQNARNIKPQQQTTRLESANEFLCLSLKFCVIPAAQSEHSRVLGGILCLFPLPWLRQVVAANRKHSTAGRNPSRISIAIRTFHSHCMGSVFQKPGCEPTNVGKNHTFLIAPNSTSSHSFPARLAHLTYKNSDSFPIPEQYT